MSKDALQSALTLARNIQNDVNAISGKPSEVRPSRTEHVLPAVLFKNTRGYVEKVVHQVNSTFEATCYDACAVMLRRLIEILIIEAFVHHQIEVKIKDVNGNFLFLEGVRYARHNERPSTT